MINATTFTRDGLVTALNALDSFAEEHFDGYTDKHLREHVAQRSGALLTTLSISTTATTMELGAYDRRVKPWRQKLARFAAPMMAAELALGYYELYRRRITSSADIDPQL